MSNMTHEQALDLIAPIEQYLNRPLPHLRELAEVNRAGLEQVLAIRGPLSHHGVLTPAQSAVAKLVATQFQDCGSCLQIEVALAVTAGVDEALVRAVVAGKPEQINDPVLRDIYHYIHATLLQQNHDELLQKLSKTLGAQALTDLAIAVAIVQFFPILKRVMGHAVSCKVNHLDYQPLPLATVAN